MDTASKSRGGTRNNQRDAVVNLRMPVAVRDRIDDAAELLNKTRTAFIIESAHKHAVDVLLDQRLFKLNDEQFKAFEKALDEPAAPNEVLKRLMARTAPWEK